MAVLGRELCLARIRRAAEYMWSYENILALIALIVCGLAIFHAQKTLEPISCLTRVPVDADIVGGSNKHGDFIIEDDGSLGRFTPDAPVLPKCVVVTRLINPVVWGVTDPVWDPVPLSVAVLDRETILVCESSQQDT